MRRSNSSNNGISEVSSVSNCPFIEIIFQNDKIIATNNDTMNPYLVEFFTAIHSVTSKYIVSHLANNSSEVNLCRKVYRKHLQATYLQAERSFTYELYHQWSKNNSHDSLMINAELPKNVTDIVNQRPRALTYPDMFLHQGQGDSGPNILVCEIKNLSYAIEKPIEVIKDIEKLINYTNEIFVMPEGQGCPSYEIGVFLLFYNTQREDDLKKLINKICHLRVFEQLKRHYERMDRIYIVLYNEQRKLKYWNAQSALKWLINELKE